MDLQHLISKMDAAIPQWNGESIGGAEPSAK
jgi:hypothetical protein